MTGAAITLGQVAELEAAGFTVTHSDWTDNGQPRRTWFYTGPSGTRSDLDYDSTDAAWEAAARDWESPFALNLPDPATAGDYLARFPEAARPYCERAYSDGWQDGATRLQEIRDAAQALLDAFGGNTPDWLQAEAAALAKALEEGGEG